MCSLIVMFQFCVTVSRVFTLVTLYSASEALFGHVQGEPAMEEEDRSAVRQARACVVIVVKG